MLKSTGRALTYSSDAALNQALGNFGGALGQILGAYYQQPEPLKPFDPFKTKSNLEKVGLTKEQSDLLSTEDLQSIYRNQSKYLGQLSEYDALIQGLTEFKQAQNESQQAELSPIERIKQAQTPQERRDVLSQVLQSPENKAQQGTLKNVLAELVTGNALTNLGQDTENSDSVVSTILKGAQSGPEGKLAAFAKGETYEDFVKRTGLKGEPGFAKKLTYDLSRMIASIPLRASSAAIGSAAGPAGAAAASFAIPELIDSTLTEYMKYKDSGGKGSVGDFLNAVKDGSIDFDTYKPITDSAKRIANQTGKAAALGPFAMFINKLKPFSKIPGLEKILGINSSKAAKDLLNTATQAGVLTTGVAAAEQKFPTSEDYSKNLATLLGFKLFGAGKDSAYNRFYKAAQQSNATPEQAAQAIQQYVAQNNLNPKVPADLKNIRNKVNNFVMGQEQEPKVAPDVIYAGPPITPQQRAFQEAQKRRAEQANAVVSPTPSEDMVSSEQRALPVTKAKSVKTPEPVKEMIKKVKETEKNVYKDAENVQTISETARAIANRPVDKYLDDQLEKEIEKNKTLTVKEQAKRDLAADLAQDLTKELRSFNTQLEAINDSLKVSGISAANEKRFLAKKAELEDSIARTTKSLKDAKDIATKGKKYQTTEEIDKKAKERVARLLEDALNPKSDSAIKTKEDFAKDQTSIDRLSEIVGKGEIPIKKVNDYHIDTLQRYNDEYRKMISSVTDNLQTAPKNEVANLNAYKSLLEKNLAINQAKIDLQKDKINTLENLSGAKGALIKQKLKEYRSDIAQLKKDFVKAVKVRDAIEEKTQKAALDKLKRPEVKAKLEKAIESNDVKEAAKIANVPQKTMQEIIDNTQKFANKIIKNNTTYQKAKDSTKDKPTGKTEEAAVNEENKTIFNNLNDYFNSLNPKLAFMARTAFGTLLQLGSKVAFGKGIPQGLLNRILNRGASTATGLGRPSVSNVTGGLAGTLYIANLLNKFYKSSQEKDFAKKLKAAKSYNDRLKILSEMDRKGLGPAAKKRIKSLAAA
jgi:hypothetical protein